MTTTPMENAPARRRRDRRALAGVIAMAVLQVVVFLITTCVWWWLHVATGERCDGSCDWRGAAQANLLYFGIAAVSFAATAAAAVISHRTGRDLAWVPAVSAVLIVVGYFPASALYGLATAA